ncbi:AraC family transcriptional regulator [Halopseudomonas pelagia]|nr:AraC family transcriptional regulator [Halopseudomonas pelagia]
MTTVKALKLALPSALMESVSGQVTHLQRQSAYQRIALTEMDELVTDLLHAVGDPLLLVRAYAGLNYQAGFLRKTYLASAFTRRDALVLLCRYFKVNNEGVALALGGEGDACVLSVAAAGCSAAACLQRDAIVYGLTRTLLSLGIKEIQHVRLAYTPDAQVQQDHRTLFPVKVLFAGPGQAQIHIGQGSLDLPLGWPSCSVEQIARRERHLMRLNPEPEWCDSVMALLPLLCRQGDVDIDQCAALLAVSRRTLQRNVQREGAAFRGLIERARKQQAQRYLLQGYSLDAVAALLGYRQSAQFYRAFRQWFGCSPTHYRSAQLSQSAINS